MKVGVADASADPAGWNVVIVPGLIIIVIMDRWRRSCANSGQRHTTSQLLAGWAAYERSEILGTRRAMGDRPAR